MLLNSQKISSLFLDCTKFLWKECSFFSLFGPFFPLCHSSESNWKTLLRISHVVEWNNSWSGWKFPRISNQRARFIDYLMYALTQLFQEVFMLKALKMLSGCLQGHMHPHTTTPCPEWSNQPEFPQQRCSYSKTVRQLHIRSKADLSLCYVCPQVFLKYVHVLIKLGTLESHVQKDETRLRHVPMYKN